METFLTSYRVTGSQDVFVAIYE